MVIGFYLRSCGEKAIPFFGPYFVYTETTGGRVARHRSHSFNLWRKGQIVARRTCKDWKQARSIPGRRLHRLLCLAAWDRAEVKRKRRLSDDLVDNMIPSCGGSCLKSEFNPTEPAGLGRWGLLGDNSLRPSQAHQMCCRVPGCQSYHFWTEYERVSANFCLFFLSYEVNGKGKDDIIRARCAQGKMRSKGSYFLVSCKQDDVRERCW